MSSASKLRIVQVCLHQGNLTEVTYNSGMSSAS